MKTKEVGSRRSQKERSDESRQRIVSAASRCIAERGYQGTSMSSIAKMAGMSVGAIQHQFADKAAVLFAVVEAGLMARAAAFSATPVVANSLEERVGEFIRRMWHEGYGGPEYGTAIEILIAMRKDPEFMNRSNDYFAHVFEFIDRLWMGIFWDLDVSRDQHLGALRLTFNTLNGMALQQLISSLEHESIESNLTQLIQSTTGLLSVNP